MHHNDKTFNIIQILTVQPLAWCAKKIISSSILFLICCCFFNLFLVSSLAYIWSIADVHFKWPASFHVPYTTQFQKSPPPLFCLDQTKLIVFFLFLFLEVQLKTKLAPISFSGVDPHRIRVASKVRSSFQQLLHPISWDHQVFFLQF